MKLGICLPHLLMYAEDRLAPAFVAQDEAFRNTLQASWPGPVAFNTEYLESLRRPGEAEQMLPAVRDEQARWPRKGLSISRTIVEAHHGRIWATREQPRGTALHVRLPASPAEA